MPGCGVDRDGLSRWIEGYEREWRTAGTAGLAELFTNDAMYLVEPYSEPIRGLESLARWWDEGRDGPDEIFAFSFSIIAVEGDVGVARVDVAYGKPIVQEYRDLWIIRFATDGRCSSFEEWPFWPGHGRSPTPER